MELDYDILIIGGGMVGASLARALRGQPLRIGVVEAVPLESDAQPSFDARAIALSHGSKRIFQAMGVWPALAAEVSAIEHIQVSDRGHFGAARLEAEEEGVEALGYVAEAALLGRVLAPTLSEQENVELICPASLSDLYIEANAAEVTLATESGERQLRAALVVAADGGRSTARELLGGKTFDLGYGQSAIISTVLSDRPHGNTAYERFTDSGPLALLPCDPAPEAEGYGHRWSLVWSAHDRQLDELLGLDDKTFLARLQERFGRRAGRFTAIGRRHSYPLGLSYLREPVRERVAFIGNAAHTIHPVGGQGFNLGLRDVAALAEVLAEALRGGEDIGALETLKGYADWRRPDYYKVMGFTDGLARGFSSRLAPLVKARTLGMLALDLLPPARRLFTRQAMGNSGRLPRLARGVPLT